MPDDTTRLDKETVDTMHAMVVAFADVLNAIAGREMKMVVLLAPTTPFGLLNGKTEVQVVTNMSREQAKEAMLSIAMQADGVRSEFVQPPIGGSPN